MLCVLWLRPIRATADGVGMLWRRNSLGDFYVKLVLGGYKSYDRKIMFSDMFRVVPVLGETADDIAFTHYGTEITRDTGKTRETERKTERGKTGRFAHVN